MCHARFPQIIKIHRKHCILYHNRKAFFFKQARLYPHDDPSHCKRNVKHPSFGGQSDRRSNGGRDSGHIAPILTTVGKATAVRQAQRSMPQPLLRHHTMPRSSSCHIQLSLAGVRRSDTKSCCCCCRCFPDRTALARPAAPVSARSKQAWDSRGRWWPDDTCMVTEHGEDVHKCRTGNFCPHLTE